MMIMSGCSPKLVEDGKRKHVFIDASKALVEVVYKIYKR
ncbi:permease [Bacillus sp. SH5-2]|nr:permease [Bacillus sp. SH5-2]